MENFKPLLLEQLLDAYCIEKESKRVIPKLKDAAKDVALEQALDAQLQTLDANITKIENVFNGIDADLDSTECNLLKPVVERAEIYLENGPINDAGIMSHLERINHYKSAIYNAAVRFAKAVNDAQLQKDLQTIASHSYNMIDRLGRLDNDRADIRAIKNL